MDEFERELLKRLTIILGIGLVVIILFSAGIYLQISHYLATH
jgi:hypothetical protein